ncbi:MAG: hypothetical protein A6F70_00090 [Cycloclasticus sp. symbiont of Bathymodiolus heckerae]|nr:MAG: hypothetical protein A6F70_00090 [Cycloclasticus sp. symbiont of Bathymodiolus heckerae]
MNINVTQQQTPSSSPIWLKRLIFIALLFCFIITALPYGIQYGIIQGLEKAGGEEVSLDDVDFNLFTGELSLHKLHSKRQQQAALSISSLKLQVDWLPLFNKRLFVSSLSIKDSNIKIDQPDSTSLYIAGIHIPLNTKKDDKQQDASWGFGLNKLHLTNNRFSYASENFSDELTIQDFFISKAFSWEPKETSDFSFDLQFNKSSIAGNIRVSMFAEYPSIEGQLKIQKLNLNDFHSLLKTQLTELKGVVDTDLTFEVLLGKNSIHVQQKGSLFINQAIISTDALNNSFSSAYWTGASTYKKMVASYRFY